MLEDRIGFTHECTYVSSYRITLVCCDPAFRIENVHHFNTHTSCVLLIHRSSPHHFHVSRNTVLKADNMQNTARKRLFSCGEDNFFHQYEQQQRPGAGDSGWLNQCLQCDEKLSGPAFVTVRVARRRLGIESDRTSPRGAVPRSWMWIG
jgi:hypothetical protein